MCEILLFSCSGWHTFVWFCFVVSAAIFFWPWNELCSCNQCCLALSCSFYSTAHKVLISTEGVWSVGEAGRSWQLFASQAPEGSKNYILPLYKLPVFTRLQRFQILCRTVTWCPYDVFINIHFGYLNILTQWRSLSCLLIVALDAFLRPPMLKLPAAVNAM